MDLSKIDLTAFADNILQQDEVESKNTLAKVFESIKDGSVNVEAFTNFVLRLVTQTNADGSDYAYYAGFSSGNYSGYSSGKRDGYDIGYNEGCRDTLEDLGC
jgi:hypothetical protein